ncbi:hypothetical protein GTP41_24410 [Pseudoduganella sp. DS3]|uniref:Uncharacterized protein n=1 Tax=Pseudoduganella guangdongensis TaxID=2692179 RepID=A0A6N9HPT3_9BURK|nr:hypothetical protein [Pseudoduganella guangdongensis]MYN05243.1 hypothetical protein [Pseudoduganella guangdongensis]
MDYDAKQAVYLPVTDYLKLDLYLMDARPGVKLDAFVTDLVNRWLAMEMERMALRERGHAMRGFQWKNVFLPEGTALRTSYCGTTEFAKVIGDKIVSDDGAHLTPSRFANRHAKGRNAWRFLWLRFPGNDFWIRACNYRMRDSERSLASLKP